ncbi:hypothetical protein TNCV_3272541 [Trichonephila clavipes]|nr:hypothetical protein TNCV_3272541 [Trichonephila clavipes]
MDSGRSTCMLKRKWFAQVYNRPHIPAFSPVDYSRPLLHGMVLQKQMDVCLPKPLTADYKRYLYVLGYQQQVYH